MPDNAAVVDHPTRERAADRPAGRRSPLAVARPLAARYALVGVWLVMAVAFAALRPETFPTVASVQVIFGTQSVLLFLAVSALCTLVVGEFDLSFANVMGLSATIVPVLSEQHHVDIAVACAIALLASLTAGAVNALFVVRFGISSLVVTLGTASLYLGLAELISGQTTVAVVDRSLARVATTSVLGLPLSFYYGLALCLGFAYLLAWTPLGRSIVFVGANRDVARLAGINVNRIRAGSYLAASLVAGLSGILIVATVGGFDSTGSAGYLLPALSAVFLGTAVVHPGRFNPMGTFLALMFLETGIYGLQLMGYSGWVQDVFFGAGLVAAVTLATVVRARSTSTS
ncbi:ABC transporter permease [Nocardioides sp. AN3]